MINTKGLIEGERVVVLLNNNMMIECRFINGVFQNIENTMHKNEVYGSSVIRYKKIIDVNYTEGEKNDTA